MIHENVNASSIKGNPAGENPLRHVAVYLPAGHNKSKQRYPVVYWAHPFGSLPADSIFYKMNDWQNLLNKAIIEKIIKPFIMVFVDNTTTYAGSNYANSKLTGNWEDLMTVEIIEHIDKKYGTIANVKSRGVAGYSMGGYGALRLAMRHPNVYCSVYAHSPVMGALTQSFSLRNDWAFEAASTAKTKEDLNENFWAQALIVYGQAFSPNLDAPPFYCDLPVSFKGDEMLINDEVLALWHKNTLVALLDENIENLRMLQAIKFDWGMYDMHYIKASCRMLTDKISSLGIVHYAEEFNGDHDRPKFTDNGPYLTEMLPFFAETLSFN